MPITPEIWLDNFYNNSNAPLSGQRPDVTELENGNFLVVWADDRNLSGPSNERNVFGTLYDGFGNIILGDMQLNISGTGASVFSPTVTELRFGQYMVSYQFTNSDGIQSIAFDRFGSDGTWLSGGAFSANNAAVTIENPSIALGDDGNVFVTYQISDPNIFPTLTQIGGRLISNDGTIGPEIIVRDDDDGMFGDNIGNPRFNDTVALDNGGYATAFAERDGESNTDSHYGIEVRLSNADGTNGALIHVTPPSDFTQPAIDSLASGGFIVTWRDIFTQEIFASIYSANGTVVVGDISLVTTGQVQNAALVTFGDGGFFLAWEDLGDTSLKGQRFDSSGNAIGTEVEIYDWGQPNEFTGRNLSLDLMTDGRILVTYYADGIFTQILDTRDEVTSSTFYTIGTTGDDVINLEFDLDSLLTAASGGPGEDIITGHEQGDIIYGGADNDTISGENGDDFIEGEGGADALSGGAGIDTVSYAGSDSAVTINLTAGIASGGHGEGDTLSGFENIIGSDFDDIITGSVKANIITSGLGDDLIFATSGANTYDGGEGVDEVDYSMSTNRVLINFLADTASTGFATGDTLIGIENLTGSNFGDDIRGDNGVNIFNGGAGKDSLIGFAGDDELYGGAGRDILNGGEGADILDGGASVDQVRYNGSTEGVNIDLGAGTASGGQAEGDVLIDIENIFGSAHGDNLYGDEGNNRIFGHLGDDFIGGGGGIDKLFGGEGSDSFVLTDGFAFVMDFVDDVDQLDVSAYGFANLQDALENVDQVGAHARFRFNGDVLLVLNTDMNDLMDDIVI